jgi:DNA polymerase-3 subunit delta'
MAKLAKKPSEEKIPLQDFNVALIGMQAPTALLAEAQAANRLHSAYLFTGREGTGKRLLALQFAASLLAPKPTEVDMFGEIPASDGLQIDWEAPELTQMKTHSNPDFIYVQPNYDAAKKRFKDIIQKEHIEEVLHFTHLKATNHWKIIIIDPAEAMNPNAANSLLKCLEEPPPHTIFILISHNPAKLLPTIRSRCLSINFPALSFNHFTEILHQQNITENHELLFHLTSGSVGLAINLSQLDFVTYWQKLLELLSTPTSSRNQSIFSLAEKINKDSDFSLQYWQMLCELAMFSIIKFQATGACAHQLIPTQLLQQLTQSKSPQAYLDALNANAQLIHDAINLYLDKKQVIIKSLSYF